MSPSDRNRVFRGQPGDNVMGGEIFTITEKKYLQSTIPGQPPVTIIISTRTEKMP